MRTPEGISFAVIQIPKFHGFILLLSKSFEATQFTGEVVSSEEGEMTWIDRAELAKIPAVDDLPELLKVFDNPDLTEFQYIVDGDEWLINLK